MIGAERDQIVIGRDAVDAEINNGGRNGGGGVNRAAAHGFDNIVRWHQHRHDAEFFHRLADDRAADANLEALEIVATDLIGLREKTWALAFMKEPTTK